MCQAARARPRGRANRGRPRKPPRRRVVPTPPSRLDPLEACGRRAPLGPARLRGTSPPRLRGALRHRPPPRLRGALRHRPPPRPRGMYFHRPSPRLRVGRHRRRLRRRQRIGIRLRNLRRRICRRCQRREGVALSGFRRPPDGREPVLLTPSPREALRRHGRRVSRPSSARPSSRTGCRSCSRR